MSTDASTPENDANLSGLGRALLGTNEGSKPAAGPWVPPTAEELNAILPQYEIVKMLGRGGMGAVYMGRQKSLDRPVAIKILSNQLEEADASFAERFKNEARAMAKLSHPGIVGVFDSGETANGLLYIVMEFIEGTDVAKMIAKSGRLHTEHAMAITAHVCDALAYAHERGIIHRDIKPANIMVGYDGVVKVADFGLAKMTHTQNTGLTQSGMAMGTLHYMAPEALMLGAGVDHRADIYAVGVMLYQMLTGKIPQGLFELPSLQVPGLDPRYDGIIGKALREDRDLRYPSVSAMRHDLDAILTQPVVKVEASADKAPAALQTQARPQRPGGQPYRPPQREVIVRSEKKGAPLLWAALIAMSAVAGWLFFHKPADQAEQSTPRSATPVALAAVEPNSSLIPASAFRFGTSRYAYYPETLGWSAAKATAEALGGHLATITSAAEDAALMEHLKSKLGPERAQFWIGGVLSKSGGSWEWVTGEKFDYTHWSPGEPNNAQGGGERAALPYVLECLIDADHLGWHDFSESQTNWQKIITGYLVEWDDVPAAIPSASAVPTSTAPSPVTATKDRPFVNSLGMKFVPVPGTKVLMCVHETRRGDYRAFAAETQEMDTQWYKAVTPEGVHVGEGDAHPVVFTSWDDASGFCKWLSKKEKLTYRLPSDVEWSVAAGVAGSEEPTGSPEDKMKNGSAGFSWGDQWPPPAKAGNFPDTATAAVFPAPPWVFVPGYSDGFATTAPVMSFPANKLGIFDLDGNVAEWCEDWFNSQQKQRVRRGSSWVSHAPIDFKLSYRGSNLPGFRRFGTGFRCVLALDEDPATTMQAAPATPRLPPATISASAPPIRSNTVDSLPTSATTWTDTKGRSITATFKGIASGNVLLDIAGKVTPVPLNTLSAESHKLARDYQQQAAPPSSDAARLQALTGRWLQTNNGRPQPVFDFEIMPDGSTLFVSPSVRVKGRMSIEGDEAVLTSENGVGYRLRLPAGNTFSSLDGTGTSKDGKAPFTLRLERAQSSTNDPALAAKYRPFVNSLGMKFVPVPGTKALFCIHEIRWKDYAAYAKENPGVDPTWKNQKHYGFELKERPEDHPVVGISWEDAVAYATWLSKKEGKTFRLPSDHEWSLAVGIGKDENPALPPEAKSGKIMGYPWGQEYPPPLGAGNYSDLSRRAVQPLPIAGNIAAYDDGFVTTAPVMSFRSNDLGIYDLGGNAREWVQDLFKPGGDRHVMRGCSWDRGNEDILRSSRRDLPGIPYRMGDCGFRLVFEPSVQGSSNAGSMPPTPTSSSLVNSPSTATKDKPFENFLGMRFVPIRITGGTTDGKNVLFSVWETRVKDFAEFAKAVNIRTNKPVFEQKPDHPVILVSWEEARSFCEWLTKQELQKGKLKAGAVFRLPSDHEWSCAVGVGERENASQLPSEKAGKLGFTFPWGADWPPTKVVGNFAGEEFRKAYEAGQYSEWARGIIDGWRDGFIETSPVGSFPANEAGLYDLSGNVWEWCEDWYDSLKKDRVFRGGSWINYASGGLSSAARGNRQPMTRFYIVGFRVVLELP